MLVKITVRNNRDSKLKEKKQINNNNNNNERQNKTKHSR